MSTLSQKRISIIGAQNEQLRELQQLLESKGAEVATLTCEQATPETIQKQKADLLLLNYVAEEEACRTVLTSLRHANLNPAIPTFVFVERTDEQIQHALSLGAVDYITPEEDSETVAEKIKTVLGEAGSVYGGSMIDITPDEADVEATGIRVYVVEDDPLLRNLLSIQLKKSSFPYEFDKDGKHALQAMRQFKPDVIILDLMLPGKSGFEVMQEIKDDPQLEQVPVIVFSNRDGADDRQKAKELGAAGFYVKAMTDLSELIETIESLVNR